MTWPDGYEPAPAAWVIDLAGRRFAQPVRQAAAGMQFRLIHGELDGVVPTRYSVEAAQALQSMGGEVTLDLLPGLGHEIDARALQLVIKYLARKFR